MPSLGKECVLVHEIVSHDFTVTLDIPESKCPNLRSNGEDLLADKSANALPDFWWLVVVHLIHCGVVD